MLPGTSSQENVPGSVFLEDGGDEEDGSYGSYGSYGKDGTYGTNRINIR